MKTIYKILVIAILVLLSPTTLFAQYSILDGNGEPIDVIGGGGGGSNSSGDCYCNFVGDYDRLAAVLRKKRDNEILGFLRNQENILKGKIQSRLGRNFPSFSEAQRAFFGERFAGQDARQLTNDLINNYKGNVGRHRARKLEDDIKVSVLNSRDGDITGNRNTLGDLKYKSRYYQGGDRFLKSMTASDVHSERFSIGADHRQLKAKFDKDSKILDGLYKVRSNGGIADLFAYGFIRHYNDQSFRTRIQLMAAYLIYERNGSPSVTWSSSFFSPNPDSYRTPAINLADNFGTPANFNIPNNISNDEAIRRYAITTLDSRVKGFVESAIPVRNATGHYLKDNTYSQASLNTANKIYQTYLSGETYVAPSGVLNSLGAPFTQTSTNRDIALRLKHNRQAEAGGMNGLANMLNELYRVRPNFKHEGAIIRQALGWNNIVKNSILSDEHYGRLFNFLTYYDNYTTIGFSTELGSSILNRGDELFYEILSTPQDVKAIQATLAVIDANALNTANNNTMLNAIRPYYTVDTTDPLFQQYIVNQIALERLKMEQSGEAAWCEQNQNQCAALLYWRASREMLHLTLDILGLVPVVGEIADITNGALYSARGDYTNASLSFAGAIPFAGWFSTGAKLAWKSIKTSKGKVIYYQMTRLSNGVIDFGKRNSKNFRDALGLVVGDGFHAHHLIPREFVKSKLVQLAAKYRKAFHIDEVLNGIPIPVGVHRDGHRLYNQKLEDILDNIGRRVNTPEQAYNEVINLTNYLRNLIESNPNLSLRQITDLIQYP